MEEYTDMYMVCNLTSVSLCVVVFPLLELFILGTGYSWDQFLYTECTDSSLKYSFLCKLKAVC